MQLQSLLILTFINALFARGSPVPVSNAIAKSASHNDHVIRDTEVYARSPEPLASIQEPRDSDVAHVAGANGYTAEDNEFYVRSVGSEGSL